MFVEMIGTPIPKVMVGTSPWIGAGQFGIKASEYRRKFLYKPKAMIEIMEASYSVGGRGAEVIPGGKILEAARFMKESRADFVVTGSTFPGPDPMIEELINTEVDIIFVHGMVADRKGLKLTRLVDEVSSRGVIPGVAVHSPISTLEFVLENLPEIRTFLVPFNGNGLFMGNQNKLETLVNNYKDCFFVGMKTMAAGNMNPQDAFNYIKNHNICSVTVGMTSVKEAKQSTELALKALNEE